jgi:hypothetical protein
VSVEARETIYEETEMSDPNTSLPNAKQTTLGLYLTAKEADRPIDSKILKSQRYKI